jgi:hypothetical protein
MAGKLDVDPQQPENAALERELRCLYATRAETFVHGQRQARVNHIKRMPQLEQQYASRFPIGPGPTACDPARSPRSGRVNRSGCNPRPGSSRWWHCRQNPVSRTTRGRCAAGSGWERPVPG